MNKLKGTCPKLQLEITKENYGAAVTAASGGCLIADAIKQQYPKFSNVTVDVATIRLTDRRRGERYIYLTPPSAAEMLIAFDQGWPGETLPRKFLIRKPVKIVPIIKTTSGLRVDAERRAARLAELEAKEKSGEPLTDGERRSIGRLRNRKEPPARPTSYGPAKAEGKGDDVVIRGGSPSTRAKVHKHNPNLLHGRTRHFGAKTATPSDVFQRALKEGVSAGVKAALARRKK